MSCLNNFQGVVSEEVEMKPIAGFSRYSATSNGDIYSCARSSTPYKLASHEQKTSVGSYLNVFVISDVGTRVQLGIHQLVCLAFNGPPPQDGQTYEVNHIDGDKHNNVATNLEWSTRSDNILHALRTGLRKDNIPVTVTDIVSGIVVTHYSITEASRQMNIPRNDLKRLMKQHSVHPYQGRWLFDFDISRLGLICRKHHKAIKAYDYISGNEIYASNATDISYMTGVHATTILVALKGGFKSHPNGNKLIGGYVFREDTDNRPYPVFTQEQIETSRERYFSRPTMVKNIPVIMKDYVTGEVTRHKSYTDAQRAAKRQVSEFQNRAMIGDLSITKGYAIKRETDSREFLVYSVDFIAASLIAKRSDFIAAKVTDMRTNTTNLHVGMNEITLAVGVKRSHLEKLRQENVETFIVNQYFQVMWIVN